MSVFASSISITVGGVEVAERYALYAETWFESQLNATPAEFQLTLKDPNQELSFTTGAEVVLTIDGVRLYGGFLFLIGRGNFFSVADTTKGTSTVRSRKWILRGVDYNILFDKRVLRNPADYLHQLTSLAGDVKDGAIIRDHLCPTYLDLAGDGIDYTTHVDDIVCPLTATNDGLDPLLSRCDPTAKWAWMQQSTFWRAQMQDLVAHSGAVYYLDAYKALWYRGLESNESRWGFSDEPNNAVIAASPTAYQGTTIGMRECEQTTDGTTLVNDALVWGGSSWVNGLVFAREKDDASITAHGRWQHAEAHPGQTDYLTQRQVDVRSWVIVHGQPGEVAQDNNRGLLVPQETCQLSWYAHRVPKLAGVPDHLHPGSLTTIVLNTFGLTLQLPLRKLRISFPTIPGSQDGVARTYVRFDGTFGLLLTDPWTLWRYLLANKDRVISQTIGGVTNGATAAPRGTQGNFEMAHVSGNIYSAPLPYVTGTSLVFVNGLMQVPGLEYTESAPQDGEITFFAPPAATPWVVCRIA